jgi:zinc protease
MPHRPGSRLTSCIAALTALVVPALASASEGPRIAIPVEQHRLENGLRVVLAPDPSLGDVTISVRYDVGSADDPPGKEGLAHVAEHVMFDGSKHVAGGDHVRLLEEAGGTAITGNAGIDETTFSESIPPGRIGLAFWLESDRMGLANDRLDPKAVEREWEAADREVDETHRTGSGTAGSEAAWGEIFGSAHPYHHVRTNRIGLGVFGAGDVRAFLRSWYTPANATLVVAGHFDPAATLALATRYFGGLPAPSPPARAAAPAEEAVPDVRLDVSASVAYELVSFAWRAPALGRPDDLALDLAASILTKHKGRLERALVDRGLASSVWAGEQSYAQGSVFHIGVSVAVKTDPEKVVPEVEQVVADLGTSISAEEIDLARRAWSDTLLARLQTSAGRAGRVADSERFDPAKYASIDAEAVKAAVRKFLVPSRRVVTVVHRNVKSPWYGVVVHREERLP